MKPHRAKAPRSRVVLVVALRPEARPLIEHFGLARAGNDAPFGLFRGDDASVHLVLSGPGRAAAAAAVAYAAASAPEDVAWLNVGIAGHRELPVGDALLAHRIHDEVAGTTWYPPLVFEPPCPTAGLRTVARPCSDYPTDDLYDMEGSAFYGVAARCSSHELVHCLKVVSDNCDRPSSRLTAARVTELIAAAVPLVSRLVDQLAGLSAEQRRLRADPPAFDEVLARAHFTVSNRRRLRLLLRRWSVACSDTDAAAWLAERRTIDASGILAELERHLDERPPRLDTGASPSSRRPERLPT